MLELVLFFAYILLCVEVVLIWLKVIPIRRYWMKMWGGPDYQFEQDSWAWSKEQLFDKPKEETLCKNKKELHKMLVFLLGHDLYCNISPYNYRLPNLVKKINKAQSTAELGLIRIEIAESFACTSWEAKEQLHCIFKYMKFPIVSSVGFVIATMVFMDLQRFAGSCV